MIHTIFLGIIGLGFLVFFHELGHCLCAHLCGITVESFSIGMGPILFHRTWRGTDYRISLIPLGGYCGMKGQKDFQTALDAELLEIQGDPDSFYGVHPAKRMVTAFAGPFFNLFLGFLAFFFVSLIGYSYETMGTAVSMADELYPTMSSPAHEAGMQTGDIITAINGKTVASFDDILTEIAIRPDEDITIQVERDGQQKDFVVHSLLDKDTGTGKVGIVANPDVLVTRTYGPYGLFPALVEGAIQTGNLLKLTVKGIFILFKGVHVTKVVSGPLRITSMFGDVVETGFSESVHSGIVNTLQFLAVISISLFFTNLLPLPILDGGLIIFAAIEWIARRKIHPKILYYIQYIGVAFIAALLILALVGDVQYLLQK